MKKAKIGFLGAGNMARSIINGLIIDGYDASLIWAADLNKNKLDSLAQQHQINTTEQAETVVELADIIVIAVKPQSLEDLSVQVSSSIKKRAPLLISIAAGITIENLESWFGHKTPIIRAMPNTPALLQTGATGLFANEATSADQRDLTESVLRAVGIVVWVKKESLMDVITALSGAGPAYYFLFMEIMQQVGQEMGLDEKAAYLLTLQTTFGAAKLALESGEPLDTLRQKVTSKGGATQAGLSSLETDGIRKLLQHALESARLRSHELSAQFGRPKKLDTDK